MRSGPAISAQTFDPAALLAVVDKYQLPAVATMPAWWRATWPAANCSSSSPASPRPTPPSSDRRIGVAREVVACIHRHSARRDGPFSTIQLCRHSRQPARNDPLFGYEGRLHRRPTGQPASSSKPERPAPRQKSPKCHGTPGQALRVLQEREVNGSAAKRPVALDIPHPPPNRDGGSGRQGAGFTDLYYRLNNFRPFRRFASGPGYSSIARRFIAAQSGRLGRYGSAFGRGRSGAAAHAWRAVLRKLDNVAARPDFSRPAPASNPNTSNWDRLRQKHRPSGGRRNRFKNKGKRSII